MKILVIDKYSISRKGMGLILLNQFPDAKLYEIESLEADAKKVVDFEPELIFMGIDHTPVLGGQQFINVLKEFYPNQRVILYNGISDYDMLVNCFQRGVDGYLSKESEVHELLNCVTKVMSGKKYASNDFLFELMLRKYQYPTKQNYVKKYTLTPHEFKIANYLAEGMKTTLIAKTLKRKSSTISTIKGNIFRKLNVDNIVSLKDAMIRNDSVH